MFLLARFPIKRISSSARFTRFSANSLNFACLSRITTLTSDISCKHVLHVRYIVRIVNIFRMGDNLTSSQRSDLMRRVRRRDTQPEMIVGLGLRKRGLKFHLHDSTLPGSPDLVFPQHSTVVFVHGCFWHRHSCRLASNPKTNFRFWQEKFEANVRRDRRKAAQLRRLGLHVFVVWQCKLMQSSVSREQYLDQLSQKILRCKS